MTKNRKISGGLDFTTHPTVPHPALYKAGIAVTGLAARMAGELRIAGADNIPSAGPMILAPAHRSHLDSPLVGLMAYRLLGAPVHFLAADKFWKGSLRPLGSVFEAVGSRSVERGKPLAPEVLEFCGELAGRGAVLGIYPEGGRRKGDGPEIRARRIKRGIVQVALATGAPIVPIGLAGTDRSYGRPGDFVAACGPPIELACVGMEGILKADSRETVSLTRPYMIELAQGLQVAQRQAHCLRDGLME